MPAIYSKVSKRGNKCIIFQMSETLQYHLFVNKDDFKWMRLVYNGEDPPSYFVVEIPREIASDVAAELLKNKDNGIFGTRRQVTKGLKTKKGKTKSYNLQNREEEGEFQSQLV